MLDDEDHPCTEDESAVTDGCELLLPIECQYAAAAMGVEPQTTEQQLLQEQFGQLAVASGEQAAALQTQMSSTASELMQHLAIPAYGNDCFAAAAMGAGAGGYVGPDQGLCQPPQPGALLSAAGMAEAPAMQAAGCFFGAGGTVMPAMGMVEIGEFQQMTEGGGGPLVATDSPDAASMTFGGNAGEMQMSGSSMSPGRLPPAAAAVTETSSLEDPNLKSARISVEERREKIHRYIKMRNERNFIKKIKYACRKTLEDSFASQFVP